MQQDYKITLPADYNHARLLFIFYVHIELHICTLITYSQLGYYSIALDPRVPLISTIPILYIYEYANPLKFPTTYTFFIGPLMDRVTHM